MSREKAFPMDVTDPPSAHWKFRRRLPRRDPGRIRGGATSGVGARGNRVPSSVVLVAS